MDWLKLTMPPSANEIPDPVGITSKIQIIYRDLGKPQDFCVFLAVGKSSRSLYFSPVAAGLCNELIGQLRDHYEVSDCDAPVDEPVDPSVGDFESGACVRLLK